MTWCSWQSKRVFNNPNCHFEPFASCHSEEAKRPKNPAQGKLREESETLPLRFAQGQGDS